MNSTRKSTLTVSPLEGYTRSLSLYLSLFLSLPLSPLSPVQSASESDDADDGNRVPNFYTSLLTGLPADCRRPLPQRLATRHLRFSGDPTKTFDFFSSFTGQHTHPRFKPVLTENFDHASLCGCDARLRSLWWVQQLTSSKNPWFFFFKSWSHYWKIEPVER